MRLHNQQHDTSRTSARDSRLPGLKMRMFLTVAKPQARIMQKIRGMGMILMKHADLARHRLGALNWAPDDETDDNDAGHNEGAHDTCNY